MKSLGVVGAGQMGSGIAQVAACSEFEVLVFDSWPESVAKSKTTISKSLAKLHEKGLIKADPASVISKIRYESSLEAFAKAGPEVVIEAVSENFAIKKEIFQSLDKLLPQTSVLASNTSSISITKLAATTQRPDRVVGIHFMNPVPIMKLVELIRGLQTSDSSFEKAKTLCSKMGKLTITSKDQPGFVVNRILMPMINEACFALEGGLATTEDIDSGMKLGTNQPMGPLALADFIGLDTCLAIMEVLFEGFGDSKYRPCPLLKQYVLAGWLGKKTGRGFYRYEQ